MKSVEVSRSLDRTGELTSYEAYVASLPESDRGAFRLVLAECMSEANVIYQPPMAFSLELGDEIGDLRFQAQRSPEVVAAWDRWSLCMAASGYDLTSRDEAAELSSTSAGPATDLLEEVGASGSLPPLSR